MGDEQRRRGRWGRRESKEDADRRDPELRPEEDELTARIDAVTRRSGLTADQIRAALRRHHPDEDNVVEEHDQPTFAETYTTESLFMGADDEPDVDPDDPWYVLGLRPGASWPEVVIAHRALAREFHPDHLSDASPEEQEAGAYRMRQVNIAYTVLKRLKEK